MGKAESFQRELGRANLELICVLQPTFAFAVHMAWPTTQLNLSSIYRWHGIESEKSFIYNLSPEAIQNGTIDPFILAATTVLHLLVSISRRLLNTNDISAFEHFVLLICIIAASVEEGAFLLLLIHGKDHTSPFFKTLNGFLFMFLNIVLHGIP